MSHRDLGSFGVAAAIAVVALAPIPAAGQASAAAKKPAAAQAYRPPLTPDGQPDLQGVWGYATITPLERPTELADKSVPTRSLLALWRQRRNSPVRWIDHK